MDPEKRQRLRQNHIDLKENLQILPVLDRLYAKRVLSEEDTDAIRSKPTTPEKIQEFLDCLKRTGNNGYSHFCDALREVQPDLLKKLEDTELDKDMLGEVSDTHIFFDPSEDFELKGLIDQLTIENKITSEQLDRMKNLVIDEKGCPEEIIERKDTTPKFLRHLMKVRLLTRYNLSFLQSLLWRVENKALCQEVAKFARQNIHRPIHFFKPRDKAENGYAFSKFHIQGDLEHFKGITIEDICERISRYLGVPSSYVIPAGVEPSESLILTIMLRKEALSLMKSVKDFTWLVDLGVDYIMYDETKIVIKDHVFNQESSTELQMLTQELKKKDESEKHLKQCLYDEQMSNEILKDLQAEQEGRLKESQETIQELNSWYNRIFAALMMSFCFIAELVSERRGLLKLDQDVHSLYSAALEKAKRFSSNHTSLLELVEATVALRKNAERGEIATTNRLACNVITFMHQNFSEALTTRMTERELGKHIRVDEVRQSTLVLELVIGLKQLEPMLQEIVTHLVNRLDDQERQKICRAFSVPESLQTPDLKHRIFEYIIFSELEKMGKLRSGTHKDTEQILRSVLKEAGRKDLWDEYKVRNEQWLRIQSEEEESENRREMYINDRFDKLEKMFQTFVGQNFMGNIAMKGLGINGAQTNVSGIPGLFGNMCNSSGAQFPTAFQLQ